MTIYNVYKFNIPTLKGTSAKNVEEHLKLYAGYVKHSNLVLEKIEELKKISDPTTTSGPGNIYLLGELSRRFSFEYNGMRNHEIYFRQFEGGAKELSDSSSLKKAIEKEWGSFDGWLQNFKTLAMTRGIGWAMLSYDNRDSRLIMSWIDEQHLGQLNGCDTILALDMWEHSYVADYQPSGKKQYVEDFFSNLNWGVVEKRLK